MEVKDLKCLVREMAVTEYSSVKKSKRSRSQEVTVIPVLYEDGSWVMIEEEAFKIDVNNKRLAPTKDVFITPKLAEQILRRSNFNNRKIICLQIKI